MHVSITAAVAAQRRERHAERQKRGYVGRTGQDVLTTGEMARICGVAPRTATRWVDQGMIPSWRVAGVRTNGSDHRRIERADLLAFLSRHGMTRALAALRADSGVLCVACAPPWLPEWAEPIIADCPAEAGALFERLVPPWAVVDAQALGVPEAVSVADWLTRQAVPPAVLLLSHPDTELPRLGGFDYLTHPAAAEQVAAWLESTR